MEMISAATSRLLFLSKLKGVGAVSLNRLVTEVAGNKVSLEKLGAYSPNLSRVLTDKAELLRARETTIRELDLCRELGLYVISPADSHYPDALGRTFDRPALLYVKGDPRALQTRAIGVIGTRQPTERGLARAREISVLICQTKSSVVSGLAFGIDAAAHQAVVDSGGTAIAVLAHGLDQVSPKRHSGLASEIVALGGALVSEYAPKVPPFPQQFVKRDRIQAGMCAGLIVVQTGVRGGSLHASRAILQYNRLLGYPIPDLEDIARREEKVEGIVKIQTDPKKMVANYLMCSVKDLERVIELRSRSDVKRFVAHADSQATLPEVSSERPLQLL